MGYFNSSDIYVYPSGFRGSDYNQSKFTTEENLTRLQGFTCLADGLYDDPRDDNYYVLRISGYTFRFLKTDSDDPDNPITSFKDLTPLLNTKYYAHINLKKLTNTNNSKDYLGFKLAPIVETEDEDDDDVLDKNSVFYGLLINNTQSAGGSTDENIVVDVELGTRRSSSEFTIAVNPPTNTILVEKADTLSTKRKINNTDFDGSSDITTDKWGTSRSITILDKSSSNSTKETGIDGGSDITLTLPSIGYAITATNLSNPPSLNVDSNNNSKITVTAGEKTSEAFTVPYAIKATQDGSSDNIESTYAHSLVLISDPADGDTIGLKNKLNTDISNSFVTVGNAKHAASSKGLDDKPSLAASNYDITVTAGGMTSTAFTVPYAKKATQDESGNNIEKTYGSSLSVSNATITLKNKNNSDLNSVTVDNVQNSTYATKIGTSSAPSSLGSENQPVHIVNGAVTPGNFIPKLNGEDQTTTANSFYAPTTGADSTQKKSGAILLSVGENAAPVWSNSNKGSEETKPLYLSPTGVLIAGSTYAGGTKVTLNGNDDRGTKSATIYAATGAQATDNNKLLKCNGINKAPTWISQNDLSVGSATNADNASKIYITTSENPQNSGYKSIQSVTSLPASSDRDPDTLYIVVEEEA